MTTLSKFFENILQERNCQEILHKESCREHLARDLLLFTLSNLKYFAPICLLPALVKIKSLNKKKLRTTLEYYIGCSLLGTSIGWSIDVLICLIRFIRGKFGFYSFLFIPSFFGSIPLYFGPSRVINLFETTVFQCKMRKSYHVTADFGNYWYWSRRLHVPGDAKPTADLFFETLESFLFLQKNIISRTIANSKFVQTCLFMTCSAVILHVKQMYSAQGFWLLEPNTKKYPLDNVEQCVQCDLHPHNSCKQYLFHGIRKYFIMGLSLDFLKMLLSSITQSQEKFKFISKLKNFRLSSAALLSAYVGIYRFVHCWLNRQSYYSDVINHNLSSFLAGSCYLLYPQPTLFSYALIQAIRSFLKTLKISIADSQNKILLIIKSIPFAKIAYSIALANMVHLAVLQPKYVNHLAITIVNAMTNKYPAKMQHRFKMLKLHKK